MKYKVKIVKAPQQETEEMKYGGQQGFGLDIGSRRIYTDYTPDPYTTGISTHLGAVPREEANIEAEKGETALVPTEDGLKHFNIGGNRHVNGGTPLNVPQGTFIYSDTKKMKLGGSVLGMFGKSPESKNKYTPAQLAKQYDLNKYEAILNDPNADYIKKRTAELMINSNKNKLAQLALVQEGKKGFPQGIPAVAQEYLAKLKGGITQAPNNEMADEADELGFASDQPEMAYGGLAMAQEGLETDLNWRGYSYAPWQGNKKDKAFATDKSSEDIYKMAYDKGYRGSPDNQSLQEWLGVDPDIKFGSNSVKALENYAAPIASITTPPTLSVTGDVVGPKPAENQVTSTTQDINAPTPGELGNNKSKPVPQGMLRPDKLNLLNKLRELGSVKQYTPWAPASPDYQYITPTYYSPDRALAENAGLAGDMARASAMLAGPAGRLANTGLYGKAADSAASIIGKYAGMNVNLANTANQENSALYNKALQESSVRAKNLYDAGIIGKQQYQNAINEAANNLTQAYSSAWNNAAQWNMMNQTDQHGYIDPNTGRYVKKYDKPFDFTNDAAGSGNTASQYDALVKHYTDEYTRLGMPKDKIAEAAAKQAQNDIDAYIKNKSTTSSSRGRSRTS